MLHILLWILKIIGILLLILVGILLVTIFLVLFVPIRYTVKADGKLGKEQPLHAQIKVSWLLHIVNVAFCYPEAAYLRVRIFCFTIFNSSKKKVNAEAESVSGGEDAKTDEIEEKSGESREIPAVSGNPETSEISEVQTKEETESVEQAKLTGVGEETKSGEETKLPEEIPEGEESQEIEEKKGIAEKFKAFCRAVRNFWNRFLEALKNIEYTIQKIYDRIKKIIENIRYYTQVLKSDVFQRAWQDCKKQLLRILRMLRPSKCRMNLLIGTGDPGSTGQIWSVYGILYPFVGNNVFLQTDFDNQIIEGDLYIKGKIRIWVFALAGFQLFIDKDIRRLLKLLKREEM